MVGAAVEVQQKKEQSTDGNNTVSLPEGFRSGVLVADVNINIDGNPCGEGSYDIKVTETETVESSAEGQAEVEAEFDIEDPETGENEVRGGIDINGNGTSTSSQKKETHVEVICE